MPLQEACNYGFVDIASILIGQGALLEVDDRVRRV